MPGTSLLALLDDITSLLTEISVLTKISAKKTVGVLGDDLAVNAEKVTEIHAHRELPVIWAIAKGSLVNKLVIIPFAIAMSIWWPRGISVLMIAGGLFLSYEGFEKIADWLSGNKHINKNSQSSDNRPPAEIDIKKREQQRISGAIKTDFILSAEIVFLSLSSVAQTPILTRLITVALLSLMLTIGVYGFVAAIVKLDDLGLWLSAHHYPRIGNTLLQTAPLLMRFLSLFGTVAIFLVSGNIIVHHVAIESFFEHIITHSNPLTHQYILHGIDFGVGMICGFFSWGIMKTTKWLFR